MKNIIRLFAIGAVAFTGVSCEDFLSADPVNRVSAEAFFVSESDLQLYCNGLLESYCPSANTIGMGDSYTDLTASKSGTDYYKPGAAWDAGKQTGWDVGDWRSIRRANIMLRDMVRAKENVSEVVYNHYEGVARFWRAYFYYSKVKTFGNVPWIDQVLDVDNALLYAGRDDREYVMSKVLEDLNFACTYCSTDTKTYKNVINRWVALAFKSRVCLFEGTYRKYHKVNPSTNQPWNNKYESADDFLQEAVDAANTIMTEAGLKLHNDYHALFTTSALGDINEVIWYREYKTSDGLNVWNDLTLNYNTSTASQKVSPTKALMNMYLTTDGTPIESDQVPMSKEFEGRDPRLCQTVHAPGHEWTYGGVTGPKPLNFTHVVTGYMFMKWSQEFENNYTTGRGDNSVPIFRLGEVLLNYAEAKAELNNGSLSQEDWNLTVGALRDRAGVKNIWPEDTANYKPDQWLIDYYAQAEGAAITNLSNTILEIRRERVTELILENLRVDDLYRWHCANLIALRDTEKGWKGVYLSADEVKNGMEFNGYTYTFTAADTNPNNYCIGTSMSDNNWTLTDGDHGYLVYHEDLRFDERMYVRPIPSAALSLNTNLGQNYGWEQ